MNEMIYYPIKTSDSFDLTELTIKELNWLDTNIAHIT